MFRFPISDTLPYANNAGELRSILQDIPAIEFAGLELKAILSFLDLTTLEGTDNLASVGQLCQKAREFGRKGMPLPAAVCVYLPFIGAVHEFLAGTPVNIAVTAGGFPSGQLPIELKAAEVRYAAEAGADEIDIVISRGTFLAGNYDTVYKELTILREAAGDRLLKVILETGELGSGEAIARASEIAIMAGADFIKTSTGKVTPAATTEAMLIMTQVIARHYQHSGKVVGIKPAGGISEPSKALEYYFIVKHVLGEDWLMPSRFRIGASRLADRLAEIIAT